MISLLRGILLEKAPPILVIDVQGVGYEVFVPMTSFYSLPDTGREIQLHTHFVVREDAQQLYGFVTSRDRELFRTLIKVNGVGPKMALGIMSGMESHEVVHCVQTNNIIALTRIPGIGKKTAERLVIELRDKLVDYAAEEISLAQGSSARLPINQTQMEAESALTALGYKPVEANRLVNQVAREQPAASSEELIRFALKAAVRM